MSKKPKVSADQALQGQLEELRRDLHKAQHDLRTAASAWQLQDWQHSHHTFNEAYSPENGDAAEWQNKALVSNLLMKAGQLAVKAEKERQALEFFEQEAKATPHGVTLRDSVKLVEAKAWCRENVGAFGKGWTNRLTANYGQSSRVFWFANKDHALLFKMSMI